MSSYGIYVGRFQPFHLGHEMAIRQIIHDDRIPVVIIGVPKEKSEKNPYDPKLVGKWVSRTLDYLNRGKEPYRIHFLHDKDTFDEWMDELYDITLNLEDDTTTTPDCMFYTGGKEEDRYDFIARGKEYKSAQWFDAVRYPVTHINKVLPIIHATDIRKDAYNNRFYLTPHVYEDIK